MCSLLISVNLSFILIVISNTRGNITFGQPRPAVLSRDLLFCQSTVPSYDNDHRPEHSLFASAQVLLLRALVTSMRTDVKARLAVFHAPALAIAIAADSKKSSSQQHPHTRSSLELSLLSNSQLWRLLEVPPGVGSRVLLASHSLSSVCNTSPP